MANTRVANSPFAQPRKPAPHKTLCSKKGVWCGGCIPTAVLAYQTSIGLKPECRICGAAYVPPVPSPAMAAIGAPGPRRGGGNGGRSGTGLPRSDLVQNNKTAVELENERLKELLKNNKIEIPVEAKASDNIEVTKLQKCVQALQEAGLDCKEAQSKLDAALAHLNGQETSIKGVLGKLQAAKNTLKQHVDNHNKLHKQLQESFQKGQSQAALVDVLQEQYKCLLKQQGFVEDTEKTSSCAPVEAPADLNEEQLGQWKQVVQAEEDEKQKLETQRVQNLKTRLETMAQNFAEANKKKQQEEDIQKEPSKDVDMESKVAGDAPSSPPGGGSKASGSGEAPSPDQVDQTLAEQAARDCNKRGATIGESKTSFEHLAKAARVETQS